MVRPVPIPAEYIGEGQRRVVMGAPNGDLTDDNIRPVEALVQNIDGVGKCFSVMIQFTPEELARMQSGHAFWLTMVGGIVPFDVSVDDTA